MAAPPNLEHGVAPLDLPAPMQPHGREELLLPRSQGQWPEVATPSLMPGAEAQRHYPPPEVRGSGQEALRPTRGQGRRPGGTTHHQRSGAVVGRHYPMPDARGGGWEEQPHVQGAVAVRAQEG